MNRLTSKERRNLTLGLTGSIGMVALTLTAIAHSYYTEPERAFEKEFTADGGCLDKTPFDLDQGAIFINHEIDGQKVLSVLPEHANTYSPSVLNFTYDIGFMNIKFQVADYDTGALTATNCGMTEGY